jgi:hypothetical protein
LCVNASPKASKLQELNARVLKVGLFLAKVGNGQRHLVSTYPSLMQSGSGKDQVPKLLEAKYRAVCKKMLTKHTIPDNQIHIDQGPPELLIPQVAEEIQAKLVNVAKSNGPCVGLKGICLPFGQIYGELHIKSSLWLAYYHYDPENSYMYPFYLIMIRSGFLK